MVPELGQFSLILALGVALVQGIVPFAGGWLVLGFLVLVVAAGAVLLGTLYPLFLDAIGMGKGSVGPPYFETVFFPLMAPLILLIGVGPFARWKQARRIDFWPRLGWSFGITVVVAVALPQAMGRWAPVVAFGVLLGIWTIASSITQLVEHLPRGGVRVTAVFAR